LPYLEVFLEHAAIPPILQLWERERVRVRGMLLDHWFLTVVMGGTVTSKGEAGTPVFTGISTVGSEWRLHDA
jgi:hypothetical protein